MRRITFAVYPGYSVMAFAAASVFETANTMHDEPPYELAFISEAGATVATSSGMRVECAPFRNARGDTLVIGGTSVLAPCSAELIELVRRAPRTFRRVVAICTGAFV